MDKYINFFNFLENKKNIDSPLEFKLLFNPIWEDRLYNFNSFNLDLEERQIEKLFFPKKININNSFVLENFDNEINMPQEIKANYISLKELTKLKSIPNKFFSKKVKINFCNEISNITNLNSEEVVINDNKKLSNISLVNCNDLTISECNSLKNVNNIICNGTSRLLNNPNLTEISNFIGDSLRIINCPNLKVFKNIKVKGLLYLHGCDLLTNLDTSVIVKGEIIKV